MRKSTIKHENLKRYIDEFHRFGEDARDDCIDMLFEELKHSCLITPSTKDGDYVNATTAKSNLGSFAVGFTDMYEFRKAFPDFSVEAHEFPFEFYAKLVRQRNLEGLIINIEGDMFIMPSDAMAEMGELPQTLFPTENTYSSDELKGLKESVDNSELEEFIKDSENFTKYDGLFDKISKSTLFTLMVSRDDLSDHIKEGIIENKPDNPLGFLYTKNVGGEYATVYTSEDKIKEIDTELNKFSQIVNFSQMVNFILNDDMAGIIINPNGENIVLTRYVLMEYYPFIEKTCYDERLNSSLFYMFEMEEEI
ncbi:SseB family protein [Methanobrevibacter sp.]|uniref:SseB family protein n=1 Tax=Methanobrevibacter sp. TaxID=66852 RepID=UPI00388F9BCF